MSGSRIHYLVPDYDVPSWGVGLLYHHVRLLREIGFDAYVVHRGKRFRLSWLDLEVPVLSIEANEFQPRPEDILVMPEVMAHDPATATWACRRVVIVLGNFLMWEGTEEAFDYRDLGFEAAMAILPSTGDIIARHCGLEPALVPPFIAPYFFADSNELSRPRERRLVMVGKPDYRQAGYLDYDIASKLLRRQVRRVGREQGRDWELLELSGQTHRQVAETMKRAAFLLNTNTLEAFNSTVPEALAAGCVVFCYDAYGGRDFLEPGKNAFVWPNNHVYPLVEELCRVIEQYDQSQDRLAAVRAAAAETAGQFQEAQTARALGSLFGGLVR